MNTNFIPTTREELNERGWAQPDIIIVTGDTYIDSPFIGAAVIGRVLESAGYKVGIIAQPTTRSGVDITRLGEPRLFWGITAGSVDSLVANFTATRKWRNDDDYTPGGDNTHRPNRACMVYANLIRQHYKPAKPIVLGGVEASLRRIAHYDFWDNAVRRSLVFDAKADIIVYGMGEKAIVELAGKMGRGEDFRDTRGICYISKTPVEGYLELPSYEQVAKDKEKFIGMFKIFSQNNDPMDARGLMQQHAGRYLIQNPPQPYLSMEEFDRVNELAYTREVHPFYAKDGYVVAQDTVKYSITATRGCFGGCAFCSIALHQGNNVISRSVESIEREAGMITGLTGSNGMISDVGGPTGNMYGMACALREKGKPCKTHECLFPKKCVNLNGSHEKLIALLRAVRKVKGVRKVALASGIRHDLVVLDEEFGKEYLRELVEYHTSGQLKLAPEHTDEKVLRLMRKPSASYLLKFKEEHDKLTSKMRRKQFLTYYFIAAHPGCWYKEMERLRVFIDEYLKITPEQVQIYTPLPSTWSAVMYYTGIDPFTDERLIVEYDNKKKQRQKDIVTKQARE
ncbi:MAG: YgiQ family radical SAM protein [Elusimicrobiota bacterium]